MAHDVVHSKHGLIESMEIEFRRYQQAEVAFDGRTWQRGAVQQIKAVFFDFDGILVDTEWAIYQAWLKCFSLENQPLPLEIYTRCIGSDFATWSPKTHLEELTGKTFDWDALDASRQNEIVAELAEEGAMPGVTEVLDLLRERGIPLAVVSSSSHFWVDGWLNKLGIFSYFDHVVCRGDAPRIKPAPDLWIEAARRFSLDPAQCLAIEDSRNGLVSAKEASLQVWAVPNRVTQCLDFSEADRVLGSLTEMISILQDDA